MQLGNILRQMFVILTGIVLLGTAASAGSSQSLGSAPEVTFDIDFPSQIQADGEQIQSFVFFKDTDKDIVQIRFELTKPHTAESLSFDSQVKGKLSGVIKFTIAATSPPLGLEVCVGEGDQCKKIHISDLAPAEVTLSVTLTDETGNVSEPKELSFQVKAIEKPNQSPVAKFTYDPTEPKVDEKVTFNAARSNDVDGTISAYAWNFGDGAISSGMTRYHKFAAPGTYNVVLTVTDNDGATNAVSHAVLVGKTNQPPTAAFTFSPTSPIAGGWVQFNASASSDSDGSISAYAWNFGDGMTSTGVTRYHKFNAAGTYNVVLTVVDTDGASDTQAHALHVGPTNQPPVAAFNYSPLSPGVGENIILDASPSYDPNGSIASYAWDLNNNGTTDATNKVISVKYYDVGAHPVRLTVTDNGGLSSSTSQSVTVKVKPALPEVGTLLYQDDFDDPGSGWLVGSSDDYEYQYQNGEYQILVKKKPGGWCYMSEAPSNATFTDFILEVDARIISGNGSIGIDFRQGNGWDQRYVIRVNAKGAYAVFKENVQAGIEGADLQEWKESLAVKPAPAWNHLKVVVKGPIILLYINSQFVARFDDSAISEGGIALESCSAGDITDGRFDNLKISSIKH